jgi:hypothetical protein
MTTLGSSPACLKSARRLGLALASTKEAFLSAATAWEVASALGRLDGFT